MDHNETSFRETLKEGSKRLSIWELEEKISIWGVRNDLSRYVDIFEEELKNRKT